MRAERLAAACVALVLPALLMAAPIDNGDSGDLLNPEGKSIGLLEFREAEMSRLRPLDSGPPDHYPPADLDPPVDITHYRIELELIPPERKFFGKTTIEGEARRDGTSSLTLDYCGPPILNVREGDTDPLYTLNDGRLTVNLSPPRQAHETFAIRVDYGGTEERGFYFPNVDPLNFSSIYTFSEPEDARYWFPCRDVPNDKVTADILVTVPDNYRVGSNGMLVEETPLDGERRRFHWSVTEPIATYLLCVYAAPYVILTDNTLPEIPIVHYVYPADAGAGARSFHRIPEMIQYFSGLFGPYPFQKYGHAEGSFPGGMEHQSLTLVGEFAVRDSANYQWLQAHELGHQWWGDAVTMEDWRHIWLNEGFASYCDALWAEHLGGPAGLAERMKVFGDVFRLGFIDRAIEEPVVNPPGNHLFTFTVYDKGAWILHMLRRIVGDEAFFQILKNYQAAHRYANANTDDFIAACETVCGEDLNWFFDPWLYVPGLPRYRLSWSQTPLAGAWTRVAVTVRQTQASPFYPMPVDFAFVTDRETVRRTEFIDQNPQTFEVTVYGALPDTGVILDPDAWILKTVDVEPQVPVRLTSFSAMRTDAGAVVRWSIDENSAGYFFTVHRGVPGEDRVRVHETPLSGRLDYEVTDAEVPPGPVDYWLRAINPAGVVEWYGPVRLSESPEVPAFTLMPVTPNPFHTSTHVAYRLAEAGPVRLLVYDAQGRVIDRLVDRVEEAGPHAVVWDGRTEGGSPAGPGIYFMRLEASGQTATRKSVLR